MFKIKWRNRFLTGEMKKKKLKEKIKNKINKGSLNNLSVLELEQIYYNLC